MCPDCRFVFKVPKDHDGTGIVCSSCRRMLRVPGDGETVAPLMAPIKKIGLSVRKMESEKDSETAESDDEAVGKENNSAEWNTNAQADDKDKAQVWRYGLLGLLFPVSLGALVLFWQLVEKQDADSQKFTDEVDASAAFDSDAPLELEVSDKIELQTIIRRGESSFLNEAESLARRFLIATHVDEILPLVNLSGGVEKKIRDYHRNGKIKPLRMFKFNANGKPNYKGRYAFVRILTPDNETKELGFIETEAGELKIDWESWVGWSEMSWKDLLIAKPTKPVLVRVQVKVVDYYNFGFSDDSKWRSYSLTSPDGKSVLYGYVERGSLLDQKLQPASRSETVAQTLKIRFPEKRLSGSQVLIEEQVADGWIVSP